VVYSWYYFFDLLISPLVFFHYWLRRRPPLPGICRAAVSQRLIVVRPLIFPPGRTYAGVALIMKFIAFARNSLKIPQSNRKTNHDSSMIKSPSKLHKMISQITGIFFSFADPSFAKAINRTLFTLYLGYEFVQVRQDCFQSPNRGRSDKKPGGVLPKPYLAGTAAHC